MSFTWLGTAGFLVRTAKTAVAIDPYISRLSWPQLVFGRMASDVDTATQLLPDVDAVLIGHSHFDHALDAPAIAQRTGAVLLGTRTTCHLAPRLVDDVSCRAVRGHEKLRVGDLLLRPLRSQHVEVPVVGVPLPGELKTPDESSSAPHLTDLPMGGALLWALHTPTLTVVHLSSSSLPSSTSALPEAFPDGVDVVLASAASHHLTPRYAERIVEELQPRLVVPHHFEDFAATLPKTLTPDQSEMGQSFVDRITALGVDAELPQPLVERVVSSSTLRPRSDLSG